LRYFQRVASGSSAAGTARESLKAMELACGKQAEATRFPFPLPPPTVGEQKAKVNTFLHFLLLSAATPSSTH